MLKIQPKTKSLRRRLKLAAIFPDQLLTLFIKLGYTVFLDICLTSKTQLLFGLDLYWQPMRVPTGLARHIVALHRLKPRDDVFKCPPELVVDAGHTVCR